MSASVTARYEQASPHTQELIDRLLAQDADDQAWAEQIGPAYRQADVAKLLGKSKQAVSRDRRLLRLQMRSGAIGYPVLQFDGQRQLTGVDEVVETLTPVVASEWTIASWLTSEQPALNGKLPIDCLRKGQVEQVVAAARHMAAALEQ